MNDRDLFYALHDRFRMRSMSTLVPYRHFDSFEDVVVAAQSKGLFGFVHHRNYSAAMAAFRDLLEDDHVFQDEWSYIARINGPMIIVSRNELDAVYLRLRI